jgi:hypothetical protein
MLKTKTQKQSAKASAGGDRAMPKSLEEELGLRPGQSLELLKELHILTREGRMNQDSRRKLKQVYHLTQFIEAGINELVERKKNQPSVTVDTNDNKPAESPVLTIADHGAGKSYLGFILYDLLIKNKWDQIEDSLQAHVYGIETRADLVGASQTLAGKLGFERMTFLNMSVDQAIHQGGLPSQIDIVTALHACDSATDDAIAFGLEKSAHFMALVPCCQAEMAGVLRGAKAVSLSRTPLAELWRHPLHTREFGSQITNVLRCLYLESQGYSLTVTELVGWEHSMKNEIILARYTGQKKKSSAERLKALVAEFGLESAAHKRFAKVFH